MLARHVLLSSATIIALVACDANKRSTDSTIAPEPRFSVSPQTPVTLSNASVPGSDVLAGVANRDRVRAPPDGSQILRATVARVVPGFSIPVRSAPHGDWIGSVTTELVTEVARDPRGDYYLVRYPDPEDGTKELGGWIFKDAVENTSWASRSSTRTSPSMVATGKEAPLACGASESQMRTDQDFCAKACNDDGACMRGETCDGLAFAAREGAGAETAHYCVSDTEPAAGQEIP